MSADSFASGDPGYQSDDAEADVHDNDTENAVAYDAKSETLPHSPVFTEEYEKLCKAISDLVKLLEAPIEESSYRDGTIEGLSKEIENRMTSNIPEEVRIALIGDMKTGKSSVINSILSLGMIARQGDAGSSCTWVVQEFGYLFPDQKQPFAAEVHFFSQEDRHSIIRALVGDFFRATPKDDDPIEGQKDHEQVVEDFAIRRTVATAFRALFVTREEFATPGAAEEYLSAANSEDDETIIEELCEWADDLMDAAFDEVDDKAGFLKHEASTAQNLLWSLASFMYTVEEREGEPYPSLWPFVSYIKFGLDVPLLKRNITLVDLPGLSDANKTRVANATNHLRQCSHYMIVAEIGRADDNQFIREHLTRGCMTRGSGRTMLVLTHADSIDDETEVSGSHKDFKQLEILKNRMKDLERKKTETVGRIKSAKGTAKYEFMELKDSITAQLRETQACHREQRISMRSRTISRKMQEMYVELTPDPVPLPVFCVGNAAYKKHQAGYGEDDPSPPTLGVEATNIPALRQHLFLAPAEAKMNEMQHTVNTQLPSLLSCFNLYVCKTHMARKDEIEKIVMEPQDLISEKIVDSFGQFRFQIEDQILSHIRDMEFDWTLEAAKLCREWAKMYGTQKHLAFLKRDGVQKAKGKNAGSISWNEELVALRAGELRHLFNDFISDIGQAPKAITKDASKLLSNMQVKIKRDPQVTIMALQPFLDYLYKERANIQPMVERIISKFRKEIGNVLSAVTSSSSDNHVVTAMVPVYAKAREIKGNKGTPKQRMNYFERTVSKVGGGVWSQAHDLLDKQLQGILGKYWDEIFAAIQSFFAAIQEKFNMLCAGKEIETPEEIELREKLQKNLVLAREQYEDVVKPAAQACFGK